MGVEEMMASKQDVGLPIKIVRVKWRDSCVLHDQQFADADFSVAIMESVGFVIQEDGEKIVLAGELCENGGYARRIIVIPKENIVLKAEITHEQKKRARTAK